MMPGNIADPAAALYRRLTWRIMPFLMLCYIVNYIDRTNIGFGKLQFLQDLHLSETTFGLITSSFFIGYILFEVPSTLLVPRIGAPKHLMRIMVGWGLVTMSMMFARNAEMFYVQRFLLGVAEAGFFPGVLFYMSLWFPNRRRARVNSLFMVAIPLAGFIGGPVSGYIMQHLDGIWGLRGWQWLFVLEGPPAIVLGILSLFVLTDGPKNARWLPDADRAQLEADLARDATERPAHAARSLGTALRYPRMWMMAAVYFSVSFFVTNQIWFPTLLKATGAGSMVSIGWITGSVSAAAAVGVLLIARHSDRTGERRWHICICCLIAAAAYALLPVGTGNVAVTSVLLAIGMIAGYGTFSVFWTLPPLYMEGPGAASGFAIVALSGAVGSSLAPALVGRVFDASGSLYIGLDIAAATMVVATVIVAALTPTQQAIDPLIGQTARAQSAANPRRARTPGG